MWRKLRIAILLLVLATVAHRAWLQERDLEWRRNIYVALYPVNVDGSPRVSTYLSTLSQEQFEPVTEYFAGQARRYGVELYHPVEIRLGGEVRALPPAPPRAASALDAAWWSLRFRWWAWRNGPQMPVSPKVRLYLLYHDAENVRALAHSTALRKGRVGLVNVYADDRHHAQNTVILAHELLHALGASDKYDLASNQPHFPDGYAHPDKLPLYPQEHAELMAGRLPLSESSAEIPSGLPQTLVGPATAREIGWSRKP